MRWQEIVYTPTFWDELATLLRSDERFSERIVLVPSAATGAVLRAALGKSHRAQGGKTLLLPRITTLERWSALSQPQGEARSETARRIELYRALRQTSWIARHWAHHEGALWGLTRDILALCDRLTLGLANADALGDVKVLATRFLAVVKGTYSARAFAAVSAEAELVDTIWRATLAAGDGAARHLLDLAALAAAAERPLTCIALVEPAPYVLGFLARYARRQDVSAILCDVPASLARQPLYALAWPELLEGKTGAQSERAPLAERIRRQADVLQGSASAMAGTLTLVPAQNLEEGAVCAAERVVGWLAEGRRAIGIVALDRAWARRVRALLERAEVLARDEAGWKLSTTIVGGALMRWLEIVQSGSVGCEIQVLLDWLKSAYALAGAPGKDAIIAAIEGSARRANVVRGWAALDGALAAEARLRRGTGAGGENTRGSAAAAQSFEAARVMLQTVRDLARPLEGRRLLVEHFAWLSASLRATQMQESFQADLVGAALLAELGRLEIEAAGAGASERFSFDEWREFISDALESATFRDAAIESPVIITSLREAAFRPFDGLVLLGANQGRLPAPGPGTLFLSDALAIELGVRDPAEEARIELALLATLMATTPVVLAVGLGIKDGEAVALAAPLERLALAWQVAGQGALKRAWDWSLYACANAARPRPAPSAAALVPEALSASGYKLLVDCPYRFFVHRMLGIDSLDELSEEVEKRDYGEIVHRILEAFHRTAPAAESFDDARARLEGLSQAAFDQAQGRGVAYLGYAVRWRGLIESYLDWWREWQEQGWRFAAAEAERRVELRLARGARLTLYGRIDRIDINDTGEVAIIDYKARSAETLRASLKEPGEDVQLPIYRLLEAGAPSARATYLSVDKRQVAAVASPWPLEELAEAVKRRLVGDLERLREGAPLPAHGAASACRFCTARGLCRKGHWLAADPP